MVLAFGNVTNTTAPWVAGPQVRGSWDILSTCLITISLCAWTALHLNVPEHGTVNRQWLRKSKWLLLGLVAPEILVYVAWRQRREAKNLLQDVRKCLGQARPPSRLSKIVDRCWGLLKWADIQREKSDTMAASPTLSIRTKSPRVPEWTLVHSFYAIMGGFALDSSAESEPLLPGNRTRAALPPDGLRFLLEHQPELLPDISQDQIEDKGKADGLKKFLVCAQALWFCASCVARLAKSLPISLLELNAMGHAACALLIYTMWWQKPLDVAEPTLIKGPKVAPLLAYMWMASGVSVKGFKSYDLHGWLRDEFDAIWMFQYPTLGDLVYADYDCIPTSSDGSSRNDHGRIGVNPQTEEDPAAAHPDEFRLGSAKYTLFSRHYTAPSIVGLKRWIISWLRSKPNLAKVGIRFPAGLGTRKTAVDHMSRADVVRRKLAHQAIEKYALEGDLCDRHYRRSEVYDEEARVKARISNAASMIGSSPHEVWFGFTLAGLLYGGLHLLAWNAPFSSRLEQISWRASASSVTITPLILAPMALISEKKALGQGGLDLIKMIRGQQPVKKGSHFMFWLRIVIVVLCVPLLITSPLLILSYVLGRVFLVVECFINITHLPEGAFKEAAWVASVPHIG